MAEVKKSLYGEGVSPQESAFLKAMKYTHHTTNKVIKSLLNKWITVNAEVADFGCGPYPLYTNTFAGVGTEIYYAFDKTVGPDGIAVADCFVRSYHSLAKTGADLVTNNRRMEVKGVVADVTDEQFQKRRYDVVLMNHLLQHLPLEKASNLLRQFKWIENTIIVSSYDWTPTILAKGECVPAVRDFIDSAMSLFGVLGSNPAFGSKDNLVNLHRKSISDACCVVDIETRFYDRPYDNYKPEIVELAASLLALSTRLGQSAITEKLAPAVETIRKMDEVFLVPATLSFLIIK